MTMNKSVQYQKLQLQGMNFLCKETPKIAHVWPFLGEIAQNT